MITIVKPHFAGHPIEQGLFIVLLYENVEFNKIN